MKIIVFITLFCIVNGCQQQNYNKTHLKTKIEHYISSVNNNQLETTEDLFSKKLAADLSNLKKNRNNYTADDQVKIEIIDYNILNINILGKNADNLNRASAQIKLTSLINGKKHKNFSTLLFEENKNHAWRINAVLPGKH